MREWSYRIHSRTVGRGFDSPQLHKEIPGHGPLSGAVVTKGRTQCLSLTVADADTPVTCGSRRGAGVWAVSASRCDHWSICMHPSPRSGHVRDHVVPRPVPSTVTLPAALSSVSTNRIVLSDTPGTARRMSAMVNWVGACNST
jgi:hypothetical protein